METSAPLAAPDITNVGQIMLILVGFVGSGKSTFAEALVEYAPMFKRCSQDELGSRQRVEGAVRAALRSGCSVCVDRTNIDRNQRANWVDIASQFSKVEVWCVKMDTSYEESLSTCAARLQTRTDHPTLTSPGHALSILKRFSREYEQPNASEGFDRMYSLRPNATPHYTSQEIHNILDLIRASPELTRDLSLNAFMTPAPGPYMGSRGGYRGAGRGYQGGAWRARGNAGWSGPGSSGRGRGWSPATAAPSWRAEVKTPAAEVKAEVIPKAEPPQSSSVSPPPRPPKQ